MAKRKESGSSRALNGAPSSSTVDPEEPVYLRTKARLWHIFPLVALEVIGQSVLIPFFPKIFAEFFDEDLRMVYWVAGGTVALNSFLTFTFAPSIGRLSDAYGRKPFLLLAVVSSHFQYFVLAFNGNLWFYFALAASTGVVAVSVALISSFVADVCPPQDRSKAFGQVVGALGVGGLLGIGLGGLLHYDIAKWIPVVLVVINSAYMIFFVPESLPLSHRAAPPGPNNPCSTWGFLRKTPIVEQVAILTFLSTVALNGIQDTILFYLRNHRHFTPENIATFLIVGMGATVLIQWVGLPFLEKHFIPRSILILSLSSASVSIGLYALAWKNWHFYLIIILSALGYLTYTVGAAVIANQGGKTDQGVLQGAFSGLNKFGMGMGPLIFNSLAGATTEVFPDAPFLLGCAVAFCALLVAFNLPEDISQVVFKSVTLSEEDLEEQTETS